MYFKNRSQGYGLIAIILHWLIAVLLIFLVVIGLYMVKLPLGIEKIKFYGWHKEIGILVLMIGICRLIWRTLNIEPLLPITLSRWQQLAAHTVHWMFYSFIILLPMSGWLLTSAAGFSFSFFGLFTFPNLMAADASVEPYLAGMHTWLGYGLIVTFFAHVGAALEHHFIRKDNILKKMLWPQ